MYVLGYSRWRGARKFLKGLHEEELEQDEFQALTGVCELLPPREMIRRLVTP